MLAKFDIALIEHIPPWTIVGTRPLCDALRLDRCAFNMWTYRSRGPTPVPATWLKGRSSGFFGWSLRRWLGDHRPPEDMVREALSQEMGPSVYEESDSVIWIYAAVRARATHTATMGVELTAEGRKAYESLAGDRAVLNAA